jgi:hypothetical protein
MVKVKVEVEVSRQSIADCLCAGFEGGIGYWAKIVSYVTPPAGSDLHVGLYDDHEVYPYYHYPMCEAGGGVVLGDAELDGDPFALTVQNAGADCTGLVTLDYASVLRGLALLAEEQPRHFTALTSGDSDAETGDVLIQLAVFGHVVFG